MRNISCFRLPRRGSYNIYRQTSRRKCHSPVPLCVQIAMNETRNIPEAKVMKLLVFVVSIEWQDSCCAIMRSSSTQTLRVLSVHARYISYRFYVVNPTNTGYDFSWEGQGNPHPSWRCVTQRGMILAGKRGEMVFEFTPDDMEIAEVCFYPGCLEFAKRWPF